MLRCCFLNSALRTGFIKNNGKLLNRSFELEHNLERSTKYVSRNFTNSKCIYVEMGKKIYHKTTKNLANQRLLAIKSKFSTSAGFEDAPSNAPKDVEISKCDDSTTKDAASPELSTVEPNSTNDTLKSNLNISGKNGPSLRTPRALSKPTKTSEDVSKLGDASDETFKTPVTMLKTPIQISCSKDGPNEFKKILMKRCDTPGETILEFYSNLSKSREDPKLSVHPVFKEISDSRIDCTLNIRWPQYLTAISSGETKEEALKLAALSVINFLERHARKLIEFESDIVRSYVEITPLPNENRQNKKKKKSNINDTLNKNNDKNLLSINNDNLNQKREFSTTSKLDLRTMLSSIKNEDEYKLEDYMKVAKTKQTPKWILHNFYLLIARDIGNSLHVSYNHATDTKWSCTYDVKWPEEMSFTKLGISKKDASSKVCHDILNWLHSKKFIDLHGKPNYLKGPQRNEEAEKFDFTPSVVRKLEEINEIYEERLLKNITESLQETDRNPTAAPNSYVEENFWPLKEKQRFLGFDVYRAKEEKKLPIMEFKENIIESMKSNRVMIVKGEPGCGKSTRVPQYVLEGWARDHADGADDCAIVVTQPRRIAAISLAERVSNERKEPLGRVVGYQVRLEKEFRPATGKILYCTNGILLRKIQNDPGLSDCTHVIIDEAHERDVNTDILMNLLRYALKLNDNLKVIVMSATIDVGVFSEYFEGAPVCEVPGVAFPVAEHFIGDVQDLDFSKTTEMCENDIPKVVIGDVVKLIDYIHTNKPEGAILCFLPGWDDIWSVQKSLPDYDDMFVHCLHSRLPLREQKQIFSKPPPSVRKLILSTNIAETSVTIDDIVYVIDTGIQKETTFDAEKGINSLDTSWISKSNVRQRKGRAGRCQPGECFHLFPSAKYLEMDEFPVPEILRTSLTKIILDSKVTSNNTNAVEFLSHLITPPSNEAVERAVLELTDLELLDRNESLTPLGRALSNFQLEPRLAKTMVNSMVFKCVTPIVDIVTLYCEDKELFLSGLTEKEEIRAIKRKFSTASDHLALMKMFERWLGYADDEDVIKAERFCSTYNLNERKLEVLRKLREIHYEYLYKYLKRVLPISDSYSNNDELVKAVLLSGVGTILEHFHMNVKGRAAKKNVLLTRNNHKVTLSSESVNSKLSTYPSDYLVYINETMSNVRRATIIRETSLLPLISVLLFKNGKIILEDLPDDEVLLKLENTKVKYKCDRRQAETLVRCKEYLQSMLHYYIFQLSKGAEYNAAINKDWNNILNLLNELLVDVKIN